MARKGPEFERGVCKRLSLWWAGRDDIFWRTAGSGGRATIRRSRGKSTRNSCGDICALDPIGQPLLDLITFECKRGYSRFTFMDLIDKPKGAKIQEYEEWIKQAVTSARNAGTPHWAIICQRMRRLPLIMMDHFLAVRLYLKTLAPLARLEFWTADGWNVVHIITFDSFLACVSPEQVRSLASQQGGGRAGSQNGQGD